MVNRLRAFNAQVAASFNARCCACDLRRYSALSGGGCGTPVAITSEAGGCLTEEELIAMIE